MTRIYRQGALRGDKIAFPEGIGCSIWYPLKEFVEELKEQPEDIGFCFDFPASDIDDLIALLQQLKDATADAYVEGSEDG